MWGKKIPSIPPPPWREETNMEKLFSKTSLGRLPRSRPSPLGSSGIGEEEGTCALSNQQVFKTTSPSSTEGNRFCNEGDFCCLFSTLEFSKASSRESVPHTSAVQRSSVTCSRSHSISCVKLRLDPLSASTSRSIFFTSWHCPNVIYQQ